MVIGAITGDIVGSVYEFHDHKSKDFELFKEKCFFTDDSVMSIAVLKALSLYSRDGDMQAFKKIVIDCMQEIGRKYPHCGYGSGFSSWMFSDYPKPYNSYGNGSAMRISAVGFYAKSKQEVIELSRAVSEVSHNHVEGIKGAEATAMAIFLARQGVYKQEIRKYITQTYYPELDGMTVDGVRKDYYFNATCQQTVPQALLCFFEAEDFEDAIRNGISIGGDSDTICAILGGVAEAYFGVPSWIQESAWYFLDDYLKAQIKESVARLIK